MSLIPEEESPVRWWRWVLLLVGWAAVGAVIGISFIDSMC